MTLIAKNTLIIAIIVLMAIIMIVFKYLPKSHLNDKPHIVLQPVQVYMTGDDELVFEFVSNQRIELKENEVNALLLCYGDKNQSEILYKPNVIKPNISSPIDDKHHYIAQKSDVGKYYYSVPLFMYINHNRGEGKMMFYDNMMTCHIRYVRFMSMKSRHSPVMQITTNELKPPHEF